MGRKILEEIVIGGLRTDLLTPERLARYRARLAQRTTEASRDASAADSDRRKKLAEVERRIANIVSAIEQGIVTPTTKERLLAAEAERDQLHKVAPVSEPVRLLPNAIERYERAVAQLPGMLERDPARAREILRRLLGTVRMVRRNGGIFAEVSTSAGALLGVASSDGSGGRI